MPLDQNLAALLTTDVVWTAKTGVDEFGQDTWASPVTLKCYPAFGARQLQKPDGSIYVSAQALYFDADDANVQSFQLGDKFTAPGIAGGMSMEAQQIEPNYSPGPHFGDPLDAWLVEVSL